MTPLDLARAFLESGQKDEFLLERLVDDQEVADEIFGFHVQQAIEKYIKAILAATQTRPTRTHDLSILLSEVSALGIQTPIESDEMQTWTPFAVRNRYPFMDTSPVVDRQTALALVKRVRKWAEEEVGSQQ